MYTIVLLQQDHVYKSVKRERSEHGAVYKALSILIHPDLSKAISWKGTNETKIPFSASPIVELVQCKFLLLYFHCRRKTVNFHILPCKLM